MRRSIAFISIATITCRVNAHAQLKIADPRKHSPIYECFIDASKAFDRINQSINFNFFNEICLLFPIVTMVFWPVDVCLLELLEIWWVFFVSNGIHQGGMLSPICSLTDDEDIVHVWKDLTHKANCMLHSFSCCNPFVKIKLFSSFCLSLYGSCL